MGLKDPAVDKLIDVVLAAKTEEELKPAVRALDRVLRAERFWVPQWSRNSHLVAYYDIYGHPGPFAALSVGTVRFLVV